MKLINIFLLFISLGAMISCTPSAPYEIRSPCVSIELENAPAGAITPCVRRPLNLDRAIV